MLVRFNEISPFGSCYEIPLLDSLGMKQDFVVKGSAEARCTLTRAGDNKVALQGRLKAMLTLVCDRCLSPYDRGVEAELQVVFEVESDDSRHLKDLVYEVPNLDTVLLDEPVIDLDDIVRQHLYLALPMKNLCSGQCRGICSRCGTNNNQAECSCADENKESPFAILAQLKKE